MNFKLSKSTPIKGKLKYVSADQSLDFIPDDQSLNPEALTDTAALVIAKTLQIEFRISDGRLLYVWGYCPQQAIIKKAESLAIPDNGEAEVYVTDLEANIGHGYDTPLSNSDIHLYENGYMLVGSIGAEEYVKIADGFIAGFSNGELVSVILKPE